MTPSWRSLPLFVLGLFLAVATPAAEAPGAAPALTTDARVALAGVTATVESRLDGMRLAARSLAATEEARSAVWRRIRGPLSALASGTPEAAATWFALPDGRYWTVEKGLTGESLRDRSYFPALLAGREVAGALVVSKSTGRRSIIVAVPVVERGKVVGAVGVSVDAVKLAAWLERAIPLPSNVVFYALDESGQTALHRAGELIFAFPTEMGSPTLRDAVRTMLSQPEGVVHYVYAGSPRTVLYARSPRTGWVFALGIAHPPADGQEPPGG